MPFSSQGGLLQVSISSSFTLIPGRTSIKPGAATRAKIETTDLDAIAETSLNGIPRYGEIECQINYNPANAAHAYVWASYVNSGGSYGVGVTEAWKHILANGTVKAFSGWVSSWEEGEDKTDGLKTVTFKVQITGAITLTP